MMFERPFDEKVEAVEKDFEAGIIDRKQYNAALHELEREWREYKQSMAG